MSTSMSMWAGQTANSVIIIRELPLKMQMSYSQREIINNDNERTYIGDVIGHPLDKLIHPSNKSIQ